MKIFSKITSNEYNNRLEKILDNKPFDENVKNLLLSMLYKIENGYNDYIKVKYNAIQKEEFMEKILNIVDEQCFEIKAVTPKTEDSKPLEEKDTICKIDIDKGYILTYANEEDLLYSLIKMNLLQEVYAYNKKNELKSFEETYYGKAIKEFILEASCLNNSEIIRDFDGWSWNNNLKNNADIEYNLVFQNIMMLSIKIDNIEFYGKKFEAIFTDDTMSLEKSMYIMMLTLVAEQNESIREEIKARLNELTSLLNLMKNNKAFLDKITDKKKAIFSDIKRIDETLNDKIKLRQEYEKRNSKLPNKDKIFSVSYLSDILERERKEKLDKIKAMNNFLDPSKYAIQKQKIENESDLLNRVIENLEDNILKKKSIVNLQMEFLNKYIKQIEQNANSKEYLEKIIYQFRYYCLLPISKGKSVNDVEELQSSIQKAMNVIIDNCIDKEIITNFSDSASLCYNILKYVFITKIIDLKEIQIRIIKVREEKYVNEIQYHITISIYDTKEAESIYNETIYNLELLNVKLNKRIPLFLK